MNFTISQADKDARNYQQWNNIIYSYKRTCGTGRYDAWFASSTVKPLLQTDGSLRDEVDKLKADVQAQDVSDMRKSELEMNAAMEQLNNIKF